MPYASADTVYLAIDNFHKIFRKSRANNHWRSLKWPRHGCIPTPRNFVPTNCTVVLSTRQWSTKKIPAEERRYFEAQKKILDNSSVGRKVPDIELTKADGTKTSFYADSAEFTLVFVYPPDCMDCSFARVRLFCRHGDQSAQRRRHSKGCEPFRG